MATQRKAAKGKRSVFDASAIQSGRIQARYDVAQTTDENATLWTGVDSLSAAQANNPSIRSIIRNRARYEVANNSYARGIIKSITNDTIGTAIQLQLGDSPRAQEIEQDFMDWARAIRLWQKLRTMRGSKCVDGEVFGMLTTNKRIRNEIKLDLKLLECDMVESWYTVLKTDEIDGIRFDESGNPTEYRVLKQHPGDYRAIKVTNAGDWIAAKYIIHYFTEERPGQVRGVSEILSSLSLFGQLRKYTAAVIEAASRAAEISSVMQTDLVPDSLAAELADPVTIIEAQRNAIVSLPEGWKLNQMKPEQPTTAYKEFKAEIIKEMARCINMPANVAQGDSSGYNYASGRLDHQSYDRAIEVERCDVVALILDRVYEEWLSEYSIRKSLSEVDKKMARSHEWHFSGRGHVDPTKEANADDTRFVNASLTKSAYYAKQGKDWKREEQQWIKERIIGEIEWNKAREEAGLDPMPYPLNKQADGAGRVIDVEPDGEETQPEGNDDEE
jgi:capsid protein